MIATGTSRKSQRTKEFILSTAISMFQQQGYESTTMRGIATQCGVALGNAYYYFDSKEHLVLGLYERTLNDQLEACQPVLVSARAMRKRLAGVLHAQLRALKPYRAALHAIFKFGADPTSPLSPFGAESARIRKGAQELFATVVADSQEKLPTDIKDALPYCLWLYSMGIIFFWLHDTSEGEKKTARLIDLTSDLIVSFILLTALPMLKPFRQSALKVIDEFRLDKTPAAKKSKG
jgi:AcrR family transcriptional regulator